MDFYWSNENHDRLQVETIVVHISVRISHNLDLLMCNFMNVDNDELTGQKIYYNRRDIFNIQVFLDIFVII